MLPETWSAKDSGVDGGAGSKVKANMESGTVLRRLPRLAEVAETAAFMASDWAGAITGTVVDISCGSVLD